jgi:polysaccharide pyruvyl transferase WcaK-like protein
MILTKENQEKWDKAKDLHNKKMEHSTDISYENESEAPSPMVNISLREYDKLKEQQKFITDKDLINCIDKIEELVRALRKHIIRTDV